MEQNKNITNSTEQATTKQLWALHCATKLNTTNLNITKQQASELISQSKQRISITLLVNNLLNGIITAEPEQPTEKRTAKKGTIKSLYDRIQFTKGTADTTKYNYRYVGSNYTGLTVKDTAIEIRKILKSNFPEVKFSVTSDYSRIDVIIKQSPYNYSKLAYAPELECRDYREYEAEHNKELNAITEYCKALLSSYNYDDSDSQSDYFNTHFYEHISIDSDYIQTEQTESITADVTDFRNKLEQKIKAEAERQEAEYQQREKEREEEHKQYLIRQEEEKKEIEFIYNSIDVKELEEDNQYFILGSQFAKLNKNCTLEEYKEEVSKGEYYLQDVKITKEIHFNNAESLEYFSNMLLNDFTFLENTGGSFTDDNRINSMVDYDIITREEQETVKFNSLGVAVYYNNKLQFVIDAQGFSYARYVGLVDNVRIEKSIITEQTITAEELQNLKEVAEVITDISTDIITNNNLLNTWNTDNWNTYKELIKQDLKKNNIKLSKPIIQQIISEGESLKVAMYKLLIEVDGIQEQFKNADLQQGQKVTLFYISDWGSITKSHITVNKVENAKYAQYDNAIKITFTPEGKRKQYYNYWYSTLLVYNGWLNLPEEVLYTIEETGTGLTMKKSKYLSCDKKQYDEILEHFEASGIKPIVNTYKPTFQN